MAYIEPKTNWVASNIPVASDLNRIEGNTKQNHEDIAAEAVSRDAAIDVEEAARIADVNAEEAARIAADAIRLSNNSLGPRTKSTITLGEWSSQVIPAGIYYVTSSSGMEIKDSTGTWNDTNSNFIVSDGVNMRWSSGSSAGTKTLIRIL